MEFKFTKIFLLMDIRFYISRFIISLVIRGDAGGIVIMDNSAKQKEKKTARLILSDLDGTLFSSQTTVSNINKKAIGDYISEGGLFGVATGRSWESVLDHCVDTMINAPCILCNGSILYDPLKKKIIECRYLEDAVIERFLRLALEQFPWVNIIAYTMDAAWILSDEKTMVPAFVDIHRPWRLGCFDDIKGRCVKILCYDRECKLYRYIRYTLGEESLGDMELVLSASEYMEILPGNVRKGNMLSSLRAYMEREYHQSCRIYALGDYYNDAELLLNADIGIAPANAVEEIKKIADRVSVSNDENVVAELIWSFNSSSERL